MTAGDCVSLNLGTGSQLAILDRALDDDAVERRPYFDGAMLQAITHIPAGRALAARRRRHGGLGHRAAAGPLGRRDGL